MISSFLKIKFKRRHQDVVHAHHVVAALAMKDTQGKKFFRYMVVFSEQIDLLHGKTIANMSKKYERIALGWADAITVVSKDAADYYTSLGYLVFQVPNAIDVASLSKRNDRRHPKQVIFAGRLSAEKGIDTLVEIGRKLPSDTHLLVLGAGPEEQKIKNLAKIKKNVSLSWLSRQRKYNLLDPWF